MRAFLGEQRLTPPLPSRFACWLLDLLAGNMGDANAGAGIRDALCSVAGLRILRKFLLFCRSADTKGKVISIVSDVFLAHAGGGGAVKWGDNKDELGLLGNLVVEEAEKQYNKENRRSDGPESRRSHTTEYLQSLVECSVAAIGMRHDQVSARK